MHKPERDPSMRGCSEAQLGFHGLGKLRAFLDPGLAPSNMDASERSTRRYSGELPASHTIGNQFQVAQG